MVEAECGMWGSKAKQKASSTPSAASNSMAWPYRAAGGASHSDGLGLQQSGRRSKMCCCAPKPQQQQEQQWEYCSALLSRTVLPDKQTLVHQQCSAVQPGAAAAAAAAAAPPCSHPEGSAQPVAGPVERRGSRRLKTAARRGATTTAARIRQPCHDA